MIGRLLFAVSFTAAALSGLLFGVDTAVIAGVTGDLTRVFGLTPTALGLTVSAALWGTLVGALFAGKPGDQFGSRAVLRVTAVFYLIAGLGCALATNLATFLIARFICGMAIGSSSVLAPVYLGEIAPPRSRGKLVGSFQLMIVVGILAAYLSNAAIEDLGLGWRWKLGATVGPALVLLASLQAIPDSPKWLRSRGRLTEADAVAKRIGMPVETDSDAFDNSDPRRKISWRRHHKPIILAIAIAFFNQMSGINVVLYYINDIGSRIAGIPPETQAIYIGLANLVFTLIGMLLIDRLGRRPLLIMGGAAMAGCLFVAALALQGTVGVYSLLPALLGFVAFFAISQGAVIWVYINEVFPTSIRSRGSSIGASTHWFLNAAIAGLFPLLREVSPALPFKIFAAAMIAQSIVVAAFFPETKGRNIEVSL